MPRKPSIVVAPPVDFDINEHFLVDYWANKIGVSVARLRQVAKIVGGNARKIRSYVEKPVDFVARDEQGVLRKLAKFAGMSDGVALSCPHHPEKRALIVKTIQPYHKTIGETPSVETFAFDGVAKLSIHLDGFVHFSRGGNEPIISGRLYPGGPPKGSGVAAPDPIIVESGPLCGILCKRPETFCEYTPKTSKPAEVFEPDDFWHHPRIKSSAAGSYNIEIFMFPLSRRNEIRETSHGLELVTELPFKSKFDFPFHLRVIEFPGLWAFFGVIVSRMISFDDEPGGYNLCGPGCGEPGGEMFAVNAFYPRPESNSREDVPSLNFHPPIELGEE